MANDINSINTNRSQQTAREIAERVKSEARSTPEQDGSGSGSSSDKVSLTDTASRLKSLERDMSSNAAVNQDRVNQVKSAISNGEYQVDADRVADKMIDFETSLRK